MRIIILYGNIFGEIDIKKEINLKNLGTSIILLSSILISCAKKNENSVSTSVESEGNTFFNNFGDAYDDYLVAIKSRANKDSWFCSSTADKNKKINSIRIESSFYSESSPTVTYVYLNYETALGNQKRKLILDEEMSKTTHHFKQLDDSKKAKMTVSFDLKTNFPKGMEHVNQLTFDGKIVYSDDSYENISCHAERYYREGELLEYL